MTIAQVLQCKKTSCR